MLTISDTSTYWLKLLVYFLTFCLFPWFSMVVFFLLSATGLFSPYPKKHKNRAAALEKNIDIFLTALQIVIRTLTTQEYELGHTFHDVLKYRHTIYQSSGCFNYFETYPSLWLFFYVWCNVFSFCFIFFSRDSFTDLSYWSDVCFISLIYFLSSRWI